MGRTFSISSQRSDITDILSRKSDQGDTDNSGRKTSSSRKSKSPNNQQSQSNLPNIDENIINSQLSPPEYYSNTPRSDSPVTPRSSSPTSPGLPPSPTYSLGNKIPSGSRKSDNFSGLEVGPPVLPPLSFLNGSDDLSKLVVNEKDAENRKKKHRSFIGEFPKDKSTKILSGVDSTDFEGFSSSSSPMSPDRPDRKNSGSSITSLSSRENEIIIIEPEESSVEELKKALIETKKKLAETERKMKVFII
jgi:hypothetical protein